MVSVDRSLQFLFWSAFLQFLFSYFFKLTFSFIFCLVLLFKETTHQQLKKRTTATEKATATLTTTAPVKCSLNHLMLYIWLEIPTFYYYVFSTNLHFHCCLALIVLNFIIAVLQYFCLVNLYNTHITTQTAETKKNKICTEFVIFTELYYTIF